MMTDDYRLIQLGEQLYRLGKEIRVLQKQLSHFQKSGILSCERSLSVYRELEEKQRLWNATEEQYLSLKKCLVPDCIQHLSDEGSTLPK